MTMLRPIRGVLCFGIAVSTLGVRSVALGQGMATSAMMELSALEEAAAVDFREITDNPDVVQAHANNVVVYGEWQGATLINGIPKGWKVIDGDIVVPGDVDGQTAATYAITGWPGGIVPYEFDANVTTANANAMLVAMGWWEGVANVDFRPRNGDDYFIHVQNNTFNNSSVGRIDNGQIINISSWGSTAIMAHELGHALGYWHEQSAVDRDTYVSVITDNVCQNCCQQSDGTMGSCNFNFQIESGSSAYGPYDFDSVMHYGRCAFSTNSAACNASCPSGTGETLVVKQPYNAQWHCAIGQRTHLSYWDSLVMSFLYPQTNWRFQSSIYGNDLNPGGFLNPYFSFSNSYGQTPSGGTLWLLDPTTLFVNFELSKPMTIAAPTGGVVLDRL